MNNKKFTNNKNQIIDLQQFKIYQNKKSLQILKLIYFYNVLFLLRSYRLSK